MEGRTPLIERQNMHGHSPAIVTRCRKQGLKFFYKNDNLKLSFLIWKFSLFDRSVMAALNNSDNCFGVVP